MTKKVTQYFPHDYNARNDPKMQELLAEMGVEGIGIYWCIVEMLYEQGGKLPIKSYKSIAFVLHVDCTCITDVVENFGLFQQDEECFWSNSINVRLGKRDEISEQRRKAVQMRWRYKCNTNISENDTNVSNSGTNVIQNDTNKIKEKEIKENKSSIAANIADAAALLIEKFTEITGLNTPMVESNLNIANEMLQLVNCEQAIVCFEYMKSAKKITNKTSFHGVKKLIAEYNLFQEAIEWHQQCEQKKENLAERQREAQMEAERERAEEMQKKARQLKALEIGVVLEKSVPGYEKMHYPTRRAIELNIAELLPTEKSEKKITQMYYSLIKAKQSKLSDLSEFCSKTD